MKKSGKKFREKFDKKFAENSVDCPADKLRLLSKQGGRAVVLFLLFLLVSTAGCGFSPQKIPYAEGTLYERIARRWDTADTSTTTQWVSYSKDLTCRSKVDFAGGKVEIETALPASENGEDEEVETDEQAEEKIVQQFKKVLTETDATRIPILSGQIANDEGKPLKPETMEKYIRKVIRPKVRKRRKTYVARDGVKRVKRKVSLEMVPNHIRVRAERYAPMIREAARKANLPADLVMGIVHKESMFNPRARSHCGALGLMQIIPKFGGKEAWEKLYKAERTPSAATLYNASQNLKLGTAYFTILEERYLKGVEQAQSRRYSAICAYNAGPTLIRRLIREHGIAGMSPEASYEVLGRVTPKETRDYLKSVRHLTARYRASGMR